MGPVFVFGTGRCGSTHLQRIVSLNTETWVWGEHDGFLNPLIRGLKAHEASTGMKRAVFDAPPLGSDAAIVERMRTETEALSWLNRLERTSLRDEIRAMIERLFSRGIPDGWTGWGFKEILYGGPDDVPAMLLELFPDCRAAFTFREPAATLDSMVRAWTPAIAREPSRVGEIPPIYEGRARKWLMLMEYFIALKRAQPGRIAMLDTEAINGPTGFLLDTMRLTARDDAMARPLPVTNRGPTMRSDAAGQMMAACFERWRDEMTDVYQTALALRDRPAR